jgi:hypothetical protein
MQLRGDKQNAPEPLLAFSISIPKNKLAAAHAGLSR